MTPGDGGSDILHLVRLYLSNHVCISAVCVFFVAVELVGGLIFNKRIHVNKQNRLADLHWDRESCDPGNGMALTERPRKTHNLKEGIN